MDVGRLAESYFQRLLHDSDPLRAVRELARTWEARGAATGGRLGTSAPERHVTMALIYDGEVGNGGHEQFFSNRGGDTVVQVRSALREIGLVEHLGILERAVALFPGGEVPADRAVVEHLLDASTEVQRALDPLDRQLWMLHPDARLLAYMREHENLLLRPERGLAVIESPT